MSHHLLFLAPAGLTLTVLFPFSDWFVDNNHPNCGTGNGSQASPFCDIQDALGVAVDGDTIHIAPGTYLENLSLARDLTLLGTGGQAATIVDGRMLDRVIAIQAGKTVTIDSLTIRNGSVDGGLIRGGGVLSLGTVTLRNSTISNNRAIGFNSYGGGIASAPGAGPLELINCVVSDNSARSGGGGVYGGGASVRLTDCTVSGNMATNSNPAASGGGLMVSNTPLYITGSTISGNSAPRGGGVYALEMSPTELRNTTISGNQGTGLFAYAYYLSPGFAVSVSNVTIVGNTAGHGFDNQWNPIAAQVRNTIIAGNAVDLTGSFNSLGHNLIGLRGTATGFVNGALGDIVGTTVAVSAGLTPLANFGGLTATHATLANSPARDAGDAAVFEITDQRGVLRTPGASDIGAFEDAIGGQIPGCNSVPNSTGVAGQLIAGGSTSTAANSFSVAAASLPPSTFGFFLVSQTQGNVAQPGGSQGVLCLGGAIGRFVGPGQVKNTGTVGSFSLLVNLMTMPTPTGPVSVAAGQTWNFQAWHRDSVSGVATSNFSAALVVQFQ